MTRKSRKGQRASNQPALTPQPLLKTGCAEANSLGAMGLGLCVASQPSQLNGIRRICSEASLRVLESSISSIPSMVRKDQKPAGTKWLGLSGGFVAFKKPPVLVGGHICSEPTNWPDQRIMHSSLFMNAMGHVSQGQEVGDVATVAVVDSNRAL